MKAITFLIALVTFIVVAGCSTSKSKHDEFQDPPVEYAKVDKVFPSTPAGSGGGFVEGVVQAVQASIRSFGNPDRNQKFTISGRCMIRSESSDPVGAPCNNVVLILKNADSMEEISRKPCDGTGAFSFRVKRDARYVLGFASPKLKLLEGAKDQGPFGAGQEILIALLLK
jgi:hypothetical protein